MKIYYEKDIKQELLKKKVIGIVGFGSQGHAHSQNLRDSGLTVLVAEAKGTTGWKNAQKAGFKPMDAGELTEEADIIVMLTPDTLQAYIYRELIAPE